VNLLFRSIGGDKRRLAVVVYIPGGLHALRSELKLARESNCPVLLLCDSAGWAEQIEREALRLLPNHRRVGLEQLQELPPELSDLAHAY
jgi:hypothetical protein